MHTSLRPMHTSTSSRARRSGPPFACYQRSASYFLQRTATCEPDVRGEPDVRVQSRSGSPRQLRRSKSASSSRNNACQRLLARAAPTLGAWRCPNRTMPATAAQPRIIRLLMTNALGMIDGRRLLLVQKAVAGGGDPGGTEARP